MSVSKPHSALAKRVWSACDAVAVARGRDNGDASTEWARFDDALNALEAEADRLFEQYGTLRAFVETVALASSVPEHWRETARAVLYPASRQEIS